MPVVDDAVLNLNSIKTLLVNDLSTFSINGKPVATDFNLLHRGLDNFTCSLLY